MDFQAIDFFILYYCMVFLILLKTLSFYLDICISYILLNLKYLKVLMKTF